MINQSGPQPSSRRYAPFAGHMLQDRALPVASAPSVGPGVHIGKDQLDTLVSRMYQAGILYAESVREFKKQFIVAVLKETGGNKVQAARKMGVRRYAIDRTTAELGIDIRAIREERRRRDIAA